MDNNVYFVHLLINVNLFIYPMLCENNMKQYFSKISTPNHLLILPENNAFLSSF